MLLLFIYSNYNFWRMSSYPDQNKKKRFRHEKCLDLLHSPYLIFLGSIIWFLVFCIIDMNLRWYKHSSWTNNCFLLAVRDGLGAFTCTSKSSCKICIWHGINSGKMFKCCDLFWIRNFKIMLFLVYHMYLVCVFLFYLQSGEMIKSNDSSASAWWIHWFITFFFSLFPPCILKVVLSTLAFTAFELPPNGAIGTRILEFLFHSRSDLVSILLSRLP